MVAEMGKDIFKKFRDGELPKDIQEQIISSANIHGLDDEKKWWFTAGFFTALQVEKYRDNTGKAKDDIWG